MLEMSRVAATCQICSPFCVSLLTLVAIWALFKVDPKRSQALKSTWRRKLRHTFLPARFCAICHLRLMLGSERDNEDSNAFMHKRSNSCSLIARKSESTNCSQRTAEISLKGKLIPPNQAMHAAKRIRVKLSWYMVLQ